jgi:hypothetical protein
VSSVLDIKILEPLCKIGNAVATVVVEAPTRELVLSAEAKKAAVSWAMGKGVRNPGIAGNVSAYPVDAAGNSDNDLLTGAAAVAAFRADIPLNETL